MNFYPFKFKPIYKEKIWGGTRLKEVFNRQLPADNIGESWEVTARTNDDSLVANGSFKGTKLSTLINDYPEEMLGQEFQSKNEIKFPLLIKLLDASKKLSVQVHPDNEYTLKVEGERGKTEMWYILDARPGAKLIYGLKPGTTRDDLARAVKQKQVERYLNKVPVKKGDILYIPAGTLHALGEGILLAEIQQNSDTTYRVYDWGRRDKSGKLRSLQIDKAIDIINFDDPVHLKSKPLILKNDDYIRSFLVTSPYFITEKVFILNKYEINPAKKRFYILIILDGQGILSYRDKTSKIKAGETIFLPAALDNVKINGKLDFIKIYLPVNRKKTTNKLIELGFAKEDIESLSGMRDW